MSGGTTAVSHHWQELAILPSVPLWEPTPSHPFPYVDLETRGFAVFLFSCVYFSEDR